MQFETLEYDLTDHIATVTLNRPEAMNSYTQEMLDDFSALWHHVRFTDDIHVVVLQGNGDRAFSSGVDRKSSPPQAENVWSRPDPGSLLGPKANGVYKPLICAVHGICAGGAFYWLNEADIIICSDDATFFDPHVTFGMTSALEPMGLSRRIPIGEALRWALMGNDERMSPQRALTIGLVSEVVERGELRDRAQVLATRIATKPPAAIQGTVKAIWQGFEMSPRQAQAVGLDYTIIGNPLAKVAFDPAAPKTQWELR